MADGGAGLERLQDKHVFTGGKVTSEGKRWEVENGFLCFPGGFTLGKMKDTYQDRAKRERADGID